MPYVDPHKAAKTFETSVLAALRAHERTDHNTTGPLCPGQSTRLGDGMERRTNRAGRPITVHAYKMPSDHMAWLYDGGGIVLVEAKRLGAASLAVIPEGDKGSGLKEHQMRALIAAQVCGGVGLLVVCMRGAVWLLNGIALGMWMEGGDASGKDTRASISIEHFREHGECLGEEGRWAFASEHFAPSGRGTVFRDGPRFLAAGVRA